VASLVAVIMVTSMTGPANAASLRITPEYFGVQDDGVQPDSSGAWASARMWAAWCTLQPTASTPIAESAARGLQRAYQTYTDSGARRLTVSLGHPAPWVFNDHPTSFQPNDRVWFCEKSAANTSFPLASELRSGPVSDAYVSYVVAVIEAGRSYLAADGRNKLVLQAWNEPNLKNGGTVSPKIPGAATTWYEAAQSLQQQERMIRGIAKAMIPGRYEITTPSLYGKKTALNTKYIKAQAKKRTVDSFSLNFYTLRQKSVNRSIKLWSKKAAVAKKLVTRYKKLRKRPIWLTETNHNLINFISNEGNVNGIWATPAAQKRLVEVTTMEAIRQGFAGIQWYQGTPTQTAVNTKPGSTATLASAALRDELLGRRLVKCSKKKSITKCRMTARPGSGRITVKWSAKGTAGVKILR